MDSKLDMKTLDVREVKDSENMIVDQERVGTSWWSQRIVGKIRYRNQSGFLEIGLMKDI